MSGVSKAIVQPLLNWYDAGHRDLPWRSEPAPYRVWVSEIMLQQTRVEAVRGYFSRWMNALPDIPALAAADEAVYTKLWEGLGYYSRVRNLHRAAVLLCEEYGGELPADYDRLLALPGVGEYTAGAVASIAFGLPVPAVDGNVYRVLTRLTDCPDPVTDIAVKHRVRRWAESAMPYEKHDIRLYNQATMDLGATVCIPVGAPRCEVCPMAEFCLARLHGTAENRPVRAPKKPRKAEDRTVFLLIRGREAAFCKRPPKGLLAGLWEFPNVEGHLTEEQVGDCLRLWDLTVKTWRRRLTARHIFTHVEWDMLCYVLEVEGEGDGLTWLDEEGARQVALPSAFRCCQTVLQERWEGW